VGTGAGEGLDEDVGAVWFEGYAICLCGVVSLRVAWVVLVHVLSVDTRQLSVLCMGICTARLTIAVVDNRVHDGYVLTAVRVPPITVSSLVLAPTRTGDIDVVEDDIARVGDEVVVLRAVSQNQIREYTVF